MGKKEKRCHQPPSLPLRQRENFVKWAKKKLKGCSLNIAAGRNKNQPLGKKQTSRFGLYSFHNLWRIFTADTANFSLFYPCWIIGLLCQAKKYNCLFLFCGRSQEKKNVMVLKNSESLTVRAPEKNSSVIK